MTLKIAVLVNVVQHCISGCPCTSPLDARALELALNITHKNTDLTAFHAGNSQNPALRRYLGMGLKAIQVLEVAKDFNPYPALLWALKEQQFDLILTGTNNIDGVNSGLVPYALGHDLNYPVISDVCKLSLKNDQIEVSQSLPKGRRRILTARLPAIVAVGEMAPTPSQSAFGKARRGKIVTISSGFPTFKLETSGVISSAKARAPQIKKFKSGVSAQQRLEAVMKAQTGSGKILTDLTAKEAAKSILKYLAKEKIFNETTNSGIDL